MRQTLIDCVDERCCCVVAHCIQSSTYNYTPVKLIDLHNLPTCIRMFCTRQTKRETQGFHRTLRDCARSNILALHTCTGISRTVVVGITVVVVVVANTSTVDVIVLVTIVKGVVELKDVTIKVATETSVSVDT